MDIDAIAVDDRRAARAVVIAEVVFVIGRVLVFPEEFAGFALETAQPRLVAVAVEDKETSAADRGHAVAGAEPLVPDDRQGFTPGGDSDAFLWRDAVAEWTQKRGPVCACLSRPEVGFAPALCR